MFYIVFNGNTIETIKYNFSAISTVEKGERILFVRIVEIEFAVS